MTDQSPDCTERPSGRRKFLRRAFKGCLYGGLGALGYAYGVEPHWVDVVSKQLPIASLPADLVGRRLIQISDLHVGETVSDSYLSESLASLSQLQPDLIVMTGDYMTSRADEQVDHTLEVLQHLPSAPLGRIAVLGNHDYSRAGFHYKAADGLYNGMSDLGIRVLRNEVMSLEGLQIAGLDEVLVGRCLPRQTLAQLDPQRASLTLCHNPDAVDLSGWDNYQGWILAGHTHGGQCKPPGFAPPITPVWNKRYTSGTFSLSGNRKMYINRGLGYFRRVRFNCRPEVTVFTLQRAKPSDALA